MKTDELVLMLAREARPVDSREKPRRIALAIALGLAGAALILMYRFGLNPRLAAATHIPMFWGKIVFSAVILGLMTVGTLRLGTPGARWGRFPAMLAAPLLVLWLVAGVALVCAAPDEREALIFGTTWRVCPFNITMLSTPAFIASLWAMRGLAPTRLRLAGAGAGLLSGAAGTVVYALHCPEMGAPFIGIWYVLGMLIPTAIGAAIGPKLLRW